MPGAYQHLAALGESAIGGTINLLTGRKSARRERMQKAYHRRQNRFVGVIK